MIANIKYNELGYAKQIYDSGFQSKYYGYELRLLAIYLRDYEKKKPEDIRTFLISFCEKYYPYYTYAAVYKLINKAVTISKNQENILIDIPEIEITEPEYDRVVGYGLSDKLTILMFCLMVRKKLSRKMYEAKNKKKSDSLYIQLSDDMISDIRLMSGIGSKKILMSMMQVLNRKGAVSAYDNALIRLDFMDGVDPGPVLLRIHNCDDTSLYFRQFWGDTKVRRCQKCGEPFFSKNNRQMFCARHQGYETMELKKFNCKKCGKEVVVSSTDRRSFLCMECAERSKDLGISQKTFYNLF